MGERPTIRVTFHGVRGSTPCHGPTTAKYGGNTSCVSIRVDGNRPIILDLGTGLRYFGATWSRSHDEPLDAIALVTHLHWDHVQGLPFFSPMLRADSRVEIFGPVQDDGRSFADAFCDTLRPPTFPVTLEAFPGEFVFHDVADDSFEIDGYRVTSRLVPHIGSTVGYRIEIGGTTIAYISDHQQPVDGSFALPDGVRDLAAGADLLIHDSQYTPLEFEKKAHWGHCTADFAVAIAAAAGAKKVALFHHDPDRTDTDLDALSWDAAQAGTEVVVAQEGTSIEF